MTRSSTAEQDDAPHWAWMFGRPAAPFCFRSRRSFGALMCRVTYRHRYVPGDPVRTAQNADRKGRLQTAVGAGANVVRSIGVEHILAHRAAAGRDPGVEWRNGLLRGEAGPTETSITTTTVSNNFYE